MGTILFLFWFQGGDPVVPAEPTNFPPIRGSLGVQVPLYGVLGIEVSLRGRP